MKYTNELDKVSYCLGLSFASNLISTGIKEVNVAAVADALQTAYEGRTPEIAPDEVSLHRSAEMSIRLTVDTLANKSQYYLVRLKNNKRHAVNGEYDNGWYKARIRNFGSYAVAVDSVCPEITPVAPERWEARGVVTLKISDDESGLNSYRGEIDGKFVLFELDGKTGRISYRLESNRVKKGSEHDLRVTVTDMCGNEQTYTHSFVW